MRSRTKISFFVFFLCLFTIQVLGAEAAAPSGIDYMSLDFWLKVLSGAGLGLMTVFVGWSKKQDPGKFDWRGLVVRVPVGIVVGIAAAVKNIPYDDAYAWAAGVGIIMLADNVSKIFIRKIWPSAPEGEKEAPKEKEKEWVKEGEGE